MKSDLLIEIVFLYCGKFQEAIQALETAAQLVDRNSYPLGLLGYVYARTGRISEAQRLLKELEEQEKKNYVPPAAIALIYLGLGEIDKSIDWIEKAVNERDVSVQVNHIVPIFDPLRSHPRYRDLLRKMNLEP